MNKSRKILELSIAFWAGIGLMSIINIWKISNTKQTLPYDWIMFGVSAVAILICATLINIKK